VLDLRTLVPIDHEAIAQTVQKTGRVLLLHEDSGFMGFGAELAAYIAQHLFEYLDAPPMRVASLDTPVPFAPPLERQYMASARLESAIQKLLEY